MTSKKQQKETSGGEWRDGSSPEPEELCMFVVMHGWYNEEDGCTNKCMYAESGEKTTQKLQERKSLGREDTKDTTKGQR